MSAAPTAPSEYITHGEFPGVDTGTCQIVEPANPIERMMLPLLNDERDVLLVRNTMIATLLAVPFAISFFLWDFPWYLALPYWALVGSYADRVGLMIHCIIHRPLYKKQHWLLEQYIPAFLCLFYGHTPHTFYIHHVGMHHAEGNMAEDTSSTMAYERDNIVHFIQYWLRFLFFGIIDLLAYHSRNKRWKLVRTLVLVEGAWYLGVLGLFLWKPAATAVVFLAPVFVMRYAMMAGNWSQHAFVDPDDPGNEFKKSITLINARHNRRCYNDGYHICHHIYPTMHWSEHPAEFERNKEKYISNGAIVFSGIKGYQEVWKHLMTHNYDYLADCFVQVGPDKMSKEEVKAMLKHRTRAIPAS